MPPSTSRRRRLSPSFGLLFLAAATPVRAQGSVEITPFIASFYALNSVNEQTNVPLTNFQGSPPGDVIRQQDDGPALGIRASFPLTGVIRLEGEAVIAFSDGSTTVRPRDEPAAALGATSSANVFLASGRAVLRPRRHNFFGLAGVGIVARGGDYWDATDQSAKIAGVVGFGVRAAVSPQLTLTFTAEAYLYNLSYNSAATGVTDDESQFQQDIIVSVGVPIGVR